ncbi:class I SAM-dependent methyltransferase [Pontibacter sp. G13]|uniref:class I SAM-dependent methyltransferase n=1 Tax=Pontibacter sp. G13 TaxID=3074898 RepID=UPI00288C0501|nr:class I SAM-dependent methyltransferase [Pontibacter sp. G13]WNJ16395.1 class I SAM-dependent methyltransferase [Pontibacter sp. G13]
MAILKKAAQKLPSYYNHACIIPQRAFEQCSSEKAASLKEASGIHCLDMTAGLGVDSYHFSQSFQNVTSLEADKLLADITRHNLKLLNTRNVEIRNESAHLFLETYKGNPFDLIFVDPDRRNSTGKRLVKLGECSPDVVSLFGRMQQLAQQIMIKASPMLDISAAWDDLPQIQVIEVVSIGNECKELLLHWRKTADANKYIHLKILRQNHRFSYEFPQGAPNKPDSRQLPAHPTVLIEPDVACYKARTTQTLFEHAFPDLPGAMNHSMGFFFGTQLPELPFPGRVWDILEMMPYKPKAIKRWLKKQGINRAHIVQRHFPFQVADIRKQLGLREGGEHWLIATRWQGEKCVIWGKAH